MRGIIIITPAMICDPSWPSGIKPMGNPSSLCYCILLLILVRFYVAGTEGLGYTSSIAASYGTQGQLCGIEASGEQVALCWGKNSSHSVQATSTEVSLAVITGGENFLCGLSTDESRAFCWVGNWTTMNTTPDQFKNTSYQTIAAGERHVCAIRSREEGARPGGIDCWGGNSSGETDPPDGLLLSSLVAGRKFTCGLDESNHARCWGTYEYNILNQIPGDEFESLSAGTNHVCGILKGSQRAKCWGDNAFRQAAPPNNVSFTVISAGMYHSCGIKADTHEVFCWGDEQFIGRGLRSRTPFLALTSAPNMTCGIREDNLLAMCWGNGIEYTPPLELFSPGVCGSRDCQSGEFNFNASAIMNLPATTVGPICRDSSQKICVPCAKSCPAGMFLSKACAADGDRTCMDCAFCQSEFCREACGGLSPPISSPQQQLVANNSRPKKFGSAATIVGAAVSGGVVVAAIGAMMFCVVYRKRLRYRFRGCASREKLSESGMITPATSNTGSIGGGGGRRYVHTHEIVRMQAFCLSELRDATNGFKEFNELGRGSYGFVYKAVLQDGRQVAVKRANATRRIQSNSRDFEAELEVLCKAHHAHLVNLLGYCEEMGERLLVYEFMPHGTLHDHLHGGLAQLNWHQRLKIATQAARGIEYLHRDASPKIIHRDIKSSNILLDGEWGARVADFGLALPEKEKGPPRSVKPSDVAYVAPEYLISQVYSEKSDVYSFGVVLLEILTGRKAYDKEYIPANLVEWATPFLRQGRTAQILDRSLDLPKNVEPLIRMGEIIELCVRFNPEERPSMSDIASWLDLVGRSSSL